MMDYVILGILLAVLAGISLRSLIREFRKGPRVIGMPDVRAPSNRELRKARRMHSAESNEKDSQEDG